MIYYAYNMYMYVLSTHVETPLHLQTILPPPPPDLGQMECQKYPLVMTNIAMV